MKRLKAFLITLTLFAGIGAGYLTPSGWAAERCEKWVAKLVSAQGSIEARRVGETAWAPVVLHDTFCPGDMIRVQERGRAAVVLSNEATLRLDQNTTITFAGMERERTFLLELLRGAAHFFSRIPRSLQVATPFVNGTVEGTEFFVKVEPAQTFLSVFAGRVLAANETGSLILESGQSAAAQIGRAPEPSIVIRPRDAVQWAIYYPPIIDYGAEDFSGDAQWQAKVRRSIEFYWSGDLTGAFSSLERIPEDITDPRFFAYRAGLLLTVGRVEEARADIERAVDLDPANSQAYALQVIAAVAQNDKSMALELAKKAVELGPKSSVAKVALSYAKQAGFDLQGALDSLQQAVTLDPENALAWARLSEVWQSFGYLDRSLETAQKAVSLNPDLERTQTVLGFAYLTQIKIQDSKNAFEQAIKLDQAAPLPRLGLGLAKIRDGDLEEGTGEIEIAACLDPNNSLIRSYLGKAYYEEKRTELDGPQYATAKELDPQDPTPWFYNAIRLQTINRPVEALHNLEKARELNDNRAVYRSQLLLDSDEAARSAALARIYSDLGFQQRALFEGWMSVNTDPSNFSAHRFLADSYSARPRHEIARVSELLQSQLLQPLNITPLQPGLAESNLFLISAQGAADLSFREFNPLFNRDRVALQATGLAGENSTWAGEGIVSGIYKNFSGSAGYTQLETDGFRTNNDQQDDIVNVFGQLELTYKTSIQAEYRYRKTENGDLRMRFFADDFESDRREEDEADSIRFGFRHTFSPSSVLIGNFMYQDSDMSATREFEEEGILVKSESKSDQNAYGGELQYQFRSEYVDIVSGGGFFDVDSTDQFTQIEDIPALEFDVPNPFPPPDFITISLPASTEVETSSLDRDVDHTNLYLYANIHLFKNLTLTLGASGDFFDSKTEDEKDADQFNPKLGIIWSPVPNTTLRAAAFRTLKRTLITNQTLEPTQVAGFNQFFDDATATTSWLYGGAIEQKFFENIYGGAEFTYRDLEVPFLIDIPAAGIRELEKADWEEKVARAYLFWTPHQWLALSGEYLYEHFERERLASGARDVKTHYVPLGINFFHPSGFSALLKGTYVNQKGSFERLFQAGVFESGEDDFWVVDAAINYRLPKRYGVITVGATNLFDKEFQYFDTDPANPRIQPDRFIFARVTLAIP